MQNTILIIGEKADAHIDVVITEVEKRGVEVFRLNAEDLLNKYEFSIGYDSNGKYGCLSDVTGRQVKLPDNIISCYYRKPQYVEPHEDITQEGVIKFTTSEGENFLRYLYTFPNLRWVNDPYTIRKSQVKFAQLDLALSLGLKVPKTIITNSIEDFRGFAEACDYDVLTKTLYTSNAFVDNISYSFLSKRISRSEFEAHISSVKYAPTLLQEYVDKKLELRVTVMGDKVFAVSLDSQALEESKEDWRAILDPEKMKHEPYTLPDKIESACRNLVKKQGLLFGAIDIIVTPDNEYVFLENNPNGQWLWLELLTELPMVNSMVDLLVKV